MVVLGGVDTVQNPFTYLAFSKTQAFSPRGRCRPFDAGADGIVISEGVAAVILKRLADAERDGDRIYAVIKGVGASSDGRCRGLTAPSFEGQVRALERAYAKAGIDPATVGYIEAHGTGTAVGDVVEIEALTGCSRPAAQARRLRGRFGQVADRPHQVRGGTRRADQCRAGTASRTLPPTIGITTPNPQLDLQEGTFRLNVEAQPWLHADGDHPRRAGVSAFGFGGTNFHAVLEAYEADPVAAPVAPDPRLAGRAARLVGRRSHRAARAIWIAWPSSYPRAARPPLRDLAHTLAARLATAGDRPDPGDRRDLARRPDRQAGPRPGRDSRRKSDELADPRGVYFAERPQFAARRSRSSSRGKGRRRSECCGDLAIHFEEIRRAFEEFDAAMLAAGRRSDRATRIFLRRPSTTRHAGGKTRPCERPRSPSRQSARRASACSGCWQESACSRTWSPGTAMANWSRCTPRAPRHPRPGQAFRMPRAGSCATRQAISQEPWPPC